LTGAGPGTYGLDVAISKRSSTDPHLAAKQRVAEAGLAYVKTGMRVGLGSGSTAELLVTGLGRLVAAGLKIVAVPTSRRTARLAINAGIPLVDFAHGTTLDVTIDGADEVDGNLDLIKGHGGALLYEKIVATAAKQLIILVDGSKRVERLGKIALPLEVIPLAAPCITATVERLGARVAPRMATNGRPFRTQAGNLILDADFGLIKDPNSLSAVLDGIPGLVEHGLFLGMATRVLVANGDEVTTLIRPGGKGDA
jgi:ribose 5-phosphate isomerase A